MRARFLNFLAWQPVLDLVSGLSHIDSSASWRSLAGNGRLLLEAAITADSQENAPVASAMLLLPEAGKSRFGSDPRYAELVLHIEPRTSDGTPIPPAGLTAWLARFTQALMIPGCFAQFLAHDLGLSTPAGPPSQLGVWLNAPRTLAELVDVGDLKPLPGSVQANWFIGYAAADENGKSATTTAQDFLAQMCDFTLHPDAWEPIMEQVDDHFN